MELIPGEVYWAVPDATVGREQSGRRPVVVVANGDYLTMATSLALVVPLTTVRRGWPNHVRVRGPLRLEQETVAMTEQVRVVSRDRLAGRLGHVSADCLAEIRQWLLDYLN